VTLLSKIQHKRNEFYQRYGMPPNAILIGPEAEVELDDMVTKLTQAGLTKPTKSADEICGLRVYRTNQIADFAVVLQHDHTV